MKSRKKYFDISKKKLSNYIFIIGFSAFSFFLGRQSVEIDTFNKQPNQYLSDSSVLSNTYLIQNFSLEGDSTDIVFRCGKSRIYHPTKTHASFKNCKSKVYELTIERAKELGMRHCRCNN